MAEVTHRFRGAAGAGVRAAFAEWVIGAAEKWGIAREVLDKVHSPKEALTMYAAVDELKARVRQEGLERGLEQGLERGRTEMRETLARMAGQKFGMAVAGKVSKVLGSEPVPARAAGVADAIIECSGAEEFLARLG